MMTEKRIPMRTCIGCREKKEKEKLLRIVCTTEGFSTDGKGILPGRGAYLCDNPECLKRVVKTRALNRAFRRAFSEEDYRRLEEEIGTGTGK